jgi:hypothetical protein
MTNATARIPVAGSCNSIKATWCDAAFAVMPCDSSKNSKKLFKTKLIRFTLTSNAVFFKTENQQLEIAQQTTSHVRIRTNGKNGERPGHIRKVANH